MSYQEEVTRLDVASTRREHVARTKEHDARSAASGASPSNTAPGTCKVLLKGVDSLYVSFPGDLSEEGHLLLEQAREAARADAESDQVLAQISLLDHLLQARASGGKHFKYLIDDHAFRIQLKSKKSKHLPLALCKISSVFLFAVGVEQAVSQLRNILSAFGKLDTVVNVSRIDLYVDFVAPLIVDQIDIRSWITRGKRKSLFWVGDVPAGWSIGEGGLMARLYDKTLEIQKSGKTHLLQHYLEQGWNGRDPVFRLEFQIRNEVLRELAASRYPAILDMLGSLWLYLMTWLRLCIVDESDKTRSRWQTHPLWIALREIEWGTSTEASRIPVLLGRTPSQERLCQAYFSALTSFMAARGLTDPDLAGEQLYLETRDFFETLSDTRGEGFYPRILNRSAKKAMGYGLPFPGIQEAAKRAQDEALADAYRKASGR